MHVPRLVTAVVFVGALASAWHRGELAAQARSGGVAAPDHPAWRVAQASRADQMSPDELLALAEAVSLVTAEPLPQGPSQAIASQERLRTLLEAACGACAPAAGPPDFSVPLSAGVVGERLARSAAAGSDPLPPVGALVAALRRGEDVDVWDEPGLAGLAVLELARLGRADRGLFERIAADGPTPADRAAAAYALAGLP